MAASDDCTDHTPMKKTLAVALTLFTPRQRKRERGQAGALKPGRSA
jgi:hypothetical protein